MIKLVATDMDGTFLGTEGKMPERAFEVIHKLHDNGITFVAASGRPLVSLNKLFDPVKDKICFVAGNGSMVYNSTEELLLKTLSNEFVDEIIRFSDNGITHPVICSKEAHYIFPRATRFFDTINFYVGDLKKITRIKEIVRPAISISVLVEDTSQTKNICQEMATLFESQATIVQTSKEWIDIIPKHCNKKDGLELLMEKFNVSKDEVMAFGDYYNDIDMLLLASESYAMTHAVDEVKKVAKHQCKPSDILHIMESI
ncbi:hypothetical protein AN639_06615 [Candidatus Epulonipiscium fishelsonii]|uniref:Uncharacterized protein n=1 Tax=Candidatus Epulonipiscium fishelsonii TaxID=77094 RepID=A0ACC8XH77_9FIRM|nr:hypothetical protein AN639_06615 [Epulopiscium sp. SCG-B05WGA-EpuloA1]ONI42828.1 hypothetical protein AN396_13065 [Epulopiscium sp. SCG-B11WGA-EpuloA1]